MRILAPTLALATVLACTGSTPPVVIDTSSDADTDADADTDSDTDADTDAGWQPSGTDADSDGFFAEYGDCDDDDIWVNPAWTETGSRATDGKDNDCDGRIDEKYDGVVVLRSDTSGTTPSTLVHIDSFGDKVDEVPLTMPVFADYSDVNVDGDGWVMYDGSQGMLFEVKHTGATTLLYNFAEHDFGEDLPPAIGSVATHRNGYYLVSGYDRLFKIDPDGSFEVLARWKCLEEDMSHDIAAAAITASPYTGEVAMFGYFGGFAFWREETGFELELAADPAAPTHAFWDAHSYKMDAHFAVGQDAATGKLGVFRYNRAQKKFALRGEVTDPDFSPQSFAIEDETGDFYFSSNPGDWRVVWRIVADGTYATQLHPGGDNELLWPVSDFMNFGAVGIRWEEPE